MRLPARAARVLTWLLAVAAMLIAALTVPAGSARAEGDNEEPRAQLTLSVSEARPGDTITVEGSLWVSAPGSRRLFVYRLPTREEIEAAGGGASLERVGDEDFTELGRVGNSSPRAIWSDGALMYVADEAHGKIYTYNMPDAIDARLASLALEGVAIGAFDPLRTEYEGVPGEGVTATVVTAEAAQPRAEVVIDPPDTDERAAGHQVALEGVPEITVTVTSADGSRTRVYRVALEVTAEEPWAHCLKGAVAAGFSLLVYEGGSVEELAACAESRGVRALYALHEGREVAYLPEAPGFVNEAFAALYPEGVPALTPLVTASSGPASADPVGELAAPDGWPGCLRGALVEDGFSIVLYEGGTVEELAACARGNAVVAAWALHSGEWVSYVPGGPEFVNRAFSGLFADGVPPLTPLVVRSKPAPAALAEEPSTRAKSGETRGPASESAECANAVEGAGEPSAWMAEVIALAGEAYLASAGVWPGFDPMEHHVVLAHRDAAGQVDELLTIGVAAPETLGRATPLSTEGTPFCSLARVDALTEETLSILNDIPYFAFQIDFGPLAEGLYVMIVTLGDDPSNPFEDAAWGWREFVMHEFFHHYQFGAWTQIHSQDFRRYPFDAGNLELAALEDRALRAAAVAPDDDTRLEAARHFAAVRLLRTERVPRITHDEEQERIEGTARYLERRLGFRFEEDGSSRLATDPEKLLESARLRGGLDGVRSYYAFLRFYETGAAITRVLDLFGVDDYAPRIEAGMSPSQVLAAYLGVTGEEVERLVGEARAAYDPEHELPALAVRLAAAAAGEDWMGPPGEDGDSLNARGERLR